MSYRLRVFPKYKSGKRSDATARCRKTVQAVVPGCATCLLLLCLLHTASAESSDAQQSYKDFRSWYVNHSVVSMVVDGSDPRAVRRQFILLKDLQKRGIVVGEVLVVGGQTDLRIKAEEGDESPRFDDLLEELALESPKRVEAASILKRFGIQRSPAWIVRFRGQDYVYDGAQRIDKHFSGKGVFRGGPHARK